MKTGHYILACLGSACAVLAGFWTLAAFGKDGFLPTEYAIYSEKRAMADRCDTGQVLVLGDSRPMVGVIPARLGGDTRNLGVGASTPIEAYFALRRAVNCPRPPRLVIFSQSIHNLTSPDNLWRFSFAYGYLDHNEFREVRDTAFRIGDASQFSSGISADGLSDAMRIRLYGESFPGFYFASMMDGMLFARHGKNSRARNDIHASGGQIFLGKADYSHDASSDVPVTAFTASPLEREYLDRLVRLAADHSVQLVVVNLPMNEGSYRRLHPGVEASWRSFWNEYARDHPTLLLVGDLVPHWDDTNFGDSEHLNQRGADAYTDWLRNQLTELRIAPFGAAQSTSP